MFWNRIKLPQLDTCHIIKFQIYGYLLSKHKESFRFILQIYSIEYKSIEYLKKKVLF